MFVARQNMFLEFPKDWPWLHSLESENREEESVHAALSMLSHPALRFQRQAFPWRDVALRLVKNRQSADRDFFEVALRQAALGV